MGTDLEVVSVSRDGKRMTVKADGSYAVLARKSNRDHLFVVVIPPRCGIATNR